MQTIKVKYNIITGQDYALVQQSSITVFGGRSVKRNKPNKPNKLKANRTGMIWRKNSKHGKTFGTDVPETTVEKYPVKNTVHSVLSEQERKTKKRAIQKERRAQREQKNMLRNMNFESFVPVHIPQIEVQPVIPLNTLALQIWLENNKFSK